MFGPSPERGWAVLLWLVRWLDLDGWNVIGQRDKAWLTDFVAAEGEVEKVGVAEQNDDEAWLIAVLVGE